ncbi:hypothetical protein B0H14DRAFT_2354969, partial [Mycena olivaceomarginata]
EDLKHFRCNRVYVPWTRKRTRSREDIEYWPGEPRLSCAVSPSLSFCQANGLKWCLRPAALLYRRLCAPRLGERTSHALAVVPPQSQAS